MSTSSRGSARRRRLWWLLPVAFIGVPLAEIWVLLQVGQLIGVWWTIVLLVVDSMIGAWVLRHEGARAWRALQDAIMAGRVPGREVADGALVLMGGALLLTPGFVSDAAGLLLMLPLTRPLARRVLASYVTRRLVVAGPGGHQGGPWASGGGASGAGRRGSPPGQGPVVEGDVVDGDDDR